MGTINEQINAHQRARDEAQRTAKQWRDTAETLADSRLALVSTAIDPQGSVGITKSQFDQSLQGAWRGDLDALKSLPALAKNYLSAFSGQASSGEEYRAMAAQISTQLYGAESLAGTQASRADRSAEIALRNVTQLETQIQQLDAQLAGIEGIQAASLTISAAADQYYAAQATYQGADFTTRVNYYEDQLSALDVVSHDLVDLDTARREYETAALALSQSQHGSNIALMQTQLTALNTINQSVVSLADAQQAYRDAGGEALQQAPSTTTLELRRIELIPQPVSRPKSASSNDTRLANEIRGLIRELAQFIDDNRRIGGQDIKISQKMVDQLEQWHHQGMPPVRSA
jgi:hypothetical protein